MPYWVIALIVLAVLLLVLLCTMLVCFFMIFFAARSGKKEEYPTPSGAAYAPHRPQMIAWIKEFREVPHKDVSIRSFDGLTLRGRYYEQKRGAPTEIMFHGYRGTSERDLCGGVARCFAIGHNALIVDHRASGESEGHVITFGVLESRDCLAWIDFFLREIDPDARLILTGISMGAATVMIAATQPLPPNVKAILADCGYTSARDIIKKVMRDMHLPAGLLYPIARLSARVLGGFDPDALSPIASMKKCKLPVIFAHGDADGFVPLSMSEENYAACTAAHKKLAVIPGAGHGLAFPVGRELYLAHLREFFAPIFNENT